jgi:hypothetical protein
MGRVLSNVRHRFLAVAGLLTLLAGCGEPPAPPLTAPPGASPSAVNASGPVLALPSGYTPPLPLPTNGLPPATIPTLPYVPPATVPPVITTPPRTTVPTTRPTSTVPPAPRCTSGPTAAQLLAVLVGQPGMPEEELKVVQGPFCASSWQFGTVRIADADPKTAEDLFVVTTGTPTALEVIEAGTDVCSTEVQSRAPAGIRVRACGA